VNSFTRATDLNRHMQTVHFPPRVDCKYKGCGRVGENGFCRTDHLNEHLREVHKEDIPMSRRREKRLRREGKLDPFQQVPLEQGRTDSH
jgi:hypothetical protein